MLDTKSLYYFINSCRVSDDLAVVIYVFNQPPLPRHPPYTTDYNQNCPSVNVKGKNCFEVLRRNL